MSCIAELFGHRQSHRKGLKTQIGSFITATLSTQEGSLLWPFGCSGFSFRKFTWKISEKSRGVEETDLYIGKGYGGRGVESGNLLKCPDSQRCDKVIASVQFSHSVVSDSASPGTAARQASLPITNSQSLLKLMSIKLVRSSNHNLGNYHLFEETQSKILEDL